MAKVAKVAETTDIDTFRSRTREGYEERRAEGRLHSAQRTCVSHDTEAGIEVRFSIQTLDLDIY
jgi:hypothetical protein